MTKDNLLETTDHRVERRGLLFGLGWRSESHSPHPTQEQECKNDIPRANIHGHQEADADNEDDDGDTPQGVLARSGDVIVVQERYDSLSHLILQPDGVLHNRYGRFLHADIIGRPLGLRWDAVGRPGGPQGRACRGFIHALAPNPPLWSMAMHHRTQVVYPHDAAIISLFLDLRPGSVLVESGTGAGSASIAFARVVAPHGKILSFEFHNERAAAARRDFQLLGLSSIIQVHAGHDVVQDGFAPVASGSADAVFLDLPAPYQVIAEAARVLRPDGALCSFSPCMEQVQRTCTELRCNELFHSLRTVTAPVRTYETRTHSSGAPGFGDEQSSRIMLQAEGVDRADPAARNAPSSKRPEVKAGGSEEPASEDTCEQAAEEAKAGVTEREDEDGVEESGVGSDGDLEVSRKRRRTNDGGSLKTRRTASLGAKYRDEQAELLGRVIQPSADVWSRPYPTMKGHTSYLTFARRTRMAVQSREPRQAMNSALTTQCVTM